MTVYIRFCSCQLNAAALIQQKYESDNLFKEVHKVKLSLILFDTILRIRYPGNILIKPKYVNYDKNLNL